MVVEEATRNTGIPWHRELNAWLARNRNRYQVVETEAEREYKNAFELWERAGHPEGLEPRTKDLGDRSIQELVEGREGRLAASEKLLVVADDRRLRRRLQTAEINADLVSTRALFGLIERYLGEGNAHDMWLAVLNANPAMDPLDEIVEVRNLSDARGSNGASS